MKKLFLLLIPAAFVLHSCNKGCNDENAANYSADDKGTKDCTYEATLTLHYDQAQSIAWDQAGVTGLRVYVGNVELSGSPYDVNTYWVTPPTCNDNGTISVTKNLGSNTTGEFTWEVKDQNDAVLKSGNWSTTGGSCDVVEVM